MTHNVISPPSIDALRKVQSINSSTMAGTSSGGPFAVLILIISSDLIGCMTGDVGRLIAL